MRWWLDKLSAQPVKEVFARIAREVFHVEHVSKDVVEG